MQKRVIHINFVDFWDGFDPYNNFIINILKQYYDVLIVENPDYLFCSVFSNNHLFYDCIKIFWTGENCCPNFNNYDYAIGFERLSFGDRYVRYPLYFVYENDYDLACVKHINAEKTLSEKTRFCSVTRSNSNANSIWEVMMDSLSRYKQVDSGGRYRNNIGGPVSDKHAFDESHKFSLAFENSSHNGYVTEKILQAFGAKTIPIYWGDPDVGKEFNPKAFINFHDYASMDDVIEKIKEIDSNDSIYLSILEEPVFIHDVRSEKEEELVEFLRHIIDQPLESASRRNIWKLGYLTELRSINAPIRYNLSIVLKLILMKIRDVVNKMLG